MTTAGNVRATINNLGLIGNSFRGSFDICDFPSAEFPAGSGVEHLFEGGFWFGAKPNGGTVLVSSGAIDASSGYSPGAAGFEFTSPDASESSKQLYERSSLFDSPLYNVNAVSHQDFYSDFTDRNVKVPGTLIDVQDHTPMNIDVHFESYNWNYTFANFFVILDFTIKNVGTDVLEEAYLGYWADGVIRNTNITAPGGSAFYNKGGNGYLDSLYLGYEFDAAGDLGFTESYMGIKFLGVEDNFGFHHPDLDTTFKCHYNTWQFRNSSDPLYFFPNNDGDKYGKMITGLNFNSGWETAIRPSIKNASNRSTMMSVGPLNPIMPGEEVRIAFAFIFAKKNEDGNPNSDDTPAQKENFIRNAQWAQTAYNGEDTNFNGLLDIDEDKDGDGEITRYILPAPPDIPRVKVVPGDNVIDVYWSDNAEYSIDPISKKQDFEGYKLYKTKVGFDVQNKTDILEELKLVSSYDTPGNQLFFDNGFGKIRLAQAKKFDGDTTSYWYHYQFKNVQNGWQHVVAVTAFDQGDEVNNLESLESTPLGNMFQVFPGKGGNIGFENGDPFVYPNPYYANASWEGSSTFEEDRKIMFANLPPHCEVRIYTVAGDFVDKFEHDETYTGDDIRWYDTYSDPEKTEFSGGEHAWDLLSKDSQIIARGNLPFLGKGPGLRKNIQRKICSNKITKSQLLNYEKRITHP